MDWSLESTEDGSRWHRRFSSFEADHNRRAQVRNGWLEAFQDLGFMPQFVSSEQLVRGFAKAGSAVVLVLPQTYALSEEECRAIQSFVIPAPQDRETTRCVFTDGTPGIFDQHANDLRTQK